MKRPRWHLLYFVLAAFDLLTISFSLILTHQIMGLYRESVGVNREWAQRLASYNNLRELAGNVNAPGNDIFDTHDPISEANKLQTRSANFDEKLIEIRRDLKENLTSEVASELLGHLELVEQAKGKMVRNAGIIFTAFRLNELDKAGEHMATMDQEFKKLNSALGKLSQRVGRIQQENFDKQIAEAADWRKFEYLIVTFIGLMVIAVTVYGHQLAKSVAGAQKEREDARKALRKAHDELEVRVQERTAELANTNVTLKNEIAERQRVEEEVRKLSRAVEQSPSLVVITDTEGRIEYANPSFTEVTGYTLDEVKGRNPRILKSGLTPHEVYERLWSTILSGNEWRGEFLNKKKSGELYWASATISPFRDAQGAISHFLDVSEDVTQRKRLEQAVVSGSENERQSIGRELHDILGQQLTGLTLLGKALEQKVEKGTLPDLEDAYGIRKLATETLDGLRKLARGLYPVEVEKYGLGSAVKDLVSDQVRLYGVKCVFNGDEELRIADPDTSINLYRIAQEAVNNAVKHADSERIEVRLQRSGDHIVLEVEDDGKGLKNTQERPRGLGLQIMKHRASVMGGLFEARSGTLGGTLIRCSTYAVDRSSSEAGKTHDVTEI